MSAATGRPDAHDAAATESPHAAAAVPAEVPLQFTVDGETSERDWPLITDSEVRTLLAAYPRAAALEALVWHSPRPLSAATIARTAAGALFIKRHHPALRDVAGLEEEHRFIAHLRERGVSVADVLLDRHGHSAIALNGWTYEVHAVSPGVDTYRGVMSWKPFFTPSHARAAGRMLATLHAAAADYGAPARALRPVLSSFRVLSSVDLAGALDAWVRAQPKLVQALGTRDWHADIVRTLGPFHRELVPLLDALPSCWTHGDWHASNLLWTGDGPDAQVRTVLDFGLSERTCTVFDMATAIERNLVDWLDPDDGRRIEFEQLDALLDGY